MAAPKITDRSPDPKPLRSMTGPVSNPLSDLPTSGQMGSYTATGNGGLRNMLPPPFPTVESGRFDQPTPVAVGDLRNMLPPPPVMGGQFLTPEQMAGLRPPPVQAVPPTHVNLPVTRREGDPVGPTHANLPVTNRVGDPVSPATKDLAQFGPGNPDYDAALAAHQKKHGLGPDNKPIPVRDRMAEKQRKRSMGVYGDAIARRRAGGGEGTFSEAELGDYGPAVRKILEDRKRAEEALGPMGDPEQAQKDLDAKPKAAEYPGWEETTTPALRSKHGETRRFKSRDGKYKLLIPQQNIGAGPSGTFSERFEGQWKDWDPDSETWVPGKSPQDDKADQNRARKEKINKARAEFNAKRGEKRGLNRPLQVGDIGYKPMLPLDKADKEKREQDARDILSDRQNEARIKRGLPPTEDYRQRHAAKESQRVQAEQGRVKAEADATDAVRKQIAEGSAARGKALAQFKADIDRTKYDRTLVQNEIKRIEGIRDKWENSPEQLAEYERQLSPLREQLSKFTNQIADLELQQGEAKRRDDDINRDYKTYGKDDPNWIHPQDATPQGGAQAGQPPEQSADTQSPYYFPPQQGEGAVAGSLPQQQGGPIVTPVTPPPADPYAEGTGELLFSPVLESQGKSPFVTMAQIQAAAQGRGIPVEEVIRLLEIQGFQSAR